MAQKNDRFTQMIAAALTAIIIIIYIASVIAPIIIIVAFIFFTVRYRKKDIVHKQNFYWLYPKQIKEFKERVRDYNQASRMKDAIQETVEKEGIAINKNGRISARSYRGKALQAELDKVNYTIGESKKHYSILRDLPRNNYKRAKRDFSMSFGMGAAIIPWIVLSFGLIFYSDAIFPVPTANTASSQTTETVTQTNPETKKDTKSGNIFWKKATSEDPFLVKLGSVSIPTTIASLSIWLVVWIIALIFFCTRNSKPPVVTIDNADTYVDYCQKKLKAKLAEKRSKEKIEIPQIDTWKKEGWIFEKLSLSCNKGNPGIVKVTIKDNRYCFMATYLNDPDFSAPLCDAMGGKNLNGQWWKYLPDSYKIPEGNFPSNFYTDNDLQRFIVDTFEHIRTFFERFHRTYQWKEKTGAHEGWEFFIWQWDVLACQKHSKAEGNPFIDVIYDETSRMTTIIFSNRSNDINLLKNKLEQIGCSDKKLNTEGRAIMEEISSTSADIIAEKINYWIQKLG